MKKILIITSILLLSSQAKVLNNKIEKAKGDDLQSKRELILGYRGNYILPNSVIIGPLADYNSIDNDIMEVISRTLNLIKDGRTPDTLDDNYKFLYRVYIEDELLDESKPESWRIGSGFSSLDRGEYRVEIIYSDYVLHGWIYLIKNESWKVNDIQLEKDQIRILDPNLPILY